nr:fructose-bisphosphatase class III [Staphylococcus pseudintermedius]
MVKFLSSVQESETLCRHVDFLMKKRNFYLRCNGSLLIHGCIPIDDLR